MDNLFPCPCCGNKTLEDIGEFDVCNICMWEDDPIQRGNPNDEIGANTKSLNEYKREWQKQNASIQTIYAAARAV